MFEPFLKQIASHYRDCDPEQLADYCFVFPNNRSGLFFIKYLSDYQREKYGDSTPLLTPHVTTLSAMAEEWSGLTKPSDIELQLILYEVYRKIAFRKSHHADGQFPMLEPDRFLFWGEIALSDFDEIDKSMAEASHLFRNLKEIKEIRTNPLNREQWELVERFWDTTFVPWTNPDEEDRMWQHIDYESKPKGVKNFLKLWEVLGPLYTEFRERLLEKGFCYQGLAFRKSVEELKRRYAEDEPMEWKRYVFIGFPHLDESEKQILGLLKKMGVAAFHWDTAMPAFDYKNENVSAFISEYIRLFPQSFPIDDIETVPSVEVKSVPSETGQVQIASHTLKTFDINASNQLETAIVLPDASLCVPLLNTLQLPEGVDVNITMGYPLRLTPAASVVDILARMHLRSRIVKGEPCYYYEDVRTLLSNPVVLGAGSAECMAINKEITERRLFNVPWNVIKEKAPSLKFLFQPLPENNAPGVFEILIDILENLRLFFEEENRLDRGFINGYISSVKELKRLSAKYLEGDSIDMPPSLILRTLERMLSRFSVNFAGTPLKGLQIMGMLETRALDFENIIITSMNERVFPRKFHKSTFIPQSLRAAYGLETSRVQEAVTTYNFYRLLARAKRVILIYNGNTSGNTSGEMSRYIYHLKYIFKPSDFKETTYSYSASLPPENTLSVRKTPEIMDILRKFTPEAPPEERRYLSASSIKTLLACPLEFYLSVVRGFSPPDEVKAFMDDSVYGKIVHTAAETLYKSEAARQNNGDEKGMARIDANVLKRLKDSKLVGHYVRRAVNKEYFSKTDSGTLKDNPLDDGLEGEALIFARLVEKSVVNLFETERKALVEETKRLRQNGIDSEASFIFVHGEEKRRMELRLADDLTVNFLHIIDRVDEFTDLSTGETYTRIVDYKTGGDSNKAKSLEHIVNYGLTTESRSGAPKAITQLMLYCNSYAVEKNYHGRIHPVLFRFSDINKGMPTANLKIGSEELTDYRDFNDEFLRLLAGHGHGEKGDEDYMAPGPLRQLFDINEPFTQAPNDNVCAFCNFKEICGRTT